MKKQNITDTGALEIIGEAVKRLLYTLREEYPQIPRQDMAGMRDRIIRGYDTVDLDIVWDTVRNETPKITPLIEQLLKEKF